MRLYHAPDAAQLPQKKSFWTHAKNLLISLVPVLLIVGMSFMMAGCETTKEVLVKETEYVPTKVADQLFTTNTAPTPPAKDEFIPFKPEGKDKTIEFLRIQRDLLAKYVEDLLKDNGVLRKQIKEIKGAQDQQVANTLKRNKAK